ncbi:helix-turn-helix domain-containing protein, partial [Rhizomonospora bruguierae]|uniref:helix-turn-helix domain-containing protein n=1 Tax=Rhizomonospora bruguierae TaxID=1581705 RepID=UPI0035E40CB2
MTDAGSVPADRLHTRPGDIPAGAAMPHECGYALTVARWTGRETRALRAALRLSVRAFAEYLGVATSTVSGWENRAGAGPPSLATQAVRDQTLKLADTDVSARFAALLRPGTHNPSEADDGDAGCAADKSSVIPLQRPQATPTAL